MSCNLCGQKMPNCDCTDRERELAEEVEELEEQLEAARKLCIAKLDEEPEPPGDEGSVQCGEQWMAQEVLRALGDSPPEPRATRWMRGE